MKVYKITHTISRFLPAGKEEVARYFSDLKVANYVFESHLDDIDYSKDEWISLAEIEITEFYGEYQEVKSKTLRYFSDDTKIGVNFNVES